MSQSAPGWYQDHDDPRLARWWDGERWTEHTLVLDEQDWSTEPEPPAGSTRFPVDTGSVTAVEGPPEGGFEEDIYAPIRDPWGDEEPAAVGVDAPTTAWQQPDEPSAWDDNTVTAAAAAAPVATGWDEDRWVAAGGKRPGGFQDWPGWAKIAVPVGALALLLIVLVASGAIGGDDDDPVSTSASSTTQAPSLADAADAALRAAGNGPFTASTFTTLIPLTCEAAEQSDPSMLTERILLLGYDPETISKLVQGLRAGTDEYCPDDMAAAPTLLNQVETAAVSGGTTSTSTAVTVPATTATTKKPTTNTTKKPVTTTTKPPVVTTTTTPPVTTTAPPATTTTIPAVTTSTAPDGP